MKKYHGAFIKNEREVGCLREANRMVANILDAVGDMVAPGLPTMRLEELAREFDALLARDATLEAQRRVGVSLVLAQKPWLLQLFRPYRRAPAD